MVGFLMAGIGQVDPTGKTNFLIVDSSWSETFSVDSYLIQEYFACSFVVDRNIFWTRVCSQQFNAANGPLSFVKHCTACSIAVVKLWISDVYS